MIDFLREPYLKQLVTQPSVDCLFWFISIQWNTLAYIKLYCLLDLPVF